ncbi:MAG: acylneuraminate cytidylyltransferase family protein [Candidatus Peribacteraceae bacterium]|nr:acylneuraminate cytidylyltransferase family protein [Candidatus Peribacteraceae bacterium]
MATELTIISKNKSNADILGLIPARGGSKGVPRKNIKDLCGKPLIAYTIIEAKQSKYLNRLIVSTDNEEIASIARSYGAEIPFLRPAYLADDSSKDIAVLRHTINSLKENDGYLPDIIVILRPTSPLKKYFHIDEAISLLLEDKYADSVRSITLARQHPLRTWRIQNGKLRSFVPENIYNFREAFNHPRQELPEAYIQNGAIDVIRRKSFEEKLSLLGETILPYVMEGKYSINIDSPLDFLVAQLLMEHCELV